MFAKIFGFDFQYFFCAYCEVYDLIPCRMKLGTIAALHIGAKTYRPIRICIVSTSGTDKDGW